MTQVFDSEVRVRDGVLSGPLREPVNTAINAKGSIHDNATATRLGLRGGTVAGSIHMDQWTPLFIEAWGQRWFERGSLSLYFLNATTDREGVRAFMRQPEPGASDTQVDVWMERHDGMRVAEGTASVGEPEALTALKSRPLDRFEVGELRILKDIGVGDPIPEVEAVYDAEEHGRRMEVITEKLAWYEDGSPWGGNIVSPAGYVHLLYSDPIAQLRGKLGQAVGLFGAIEIKNVNGPALVGVPYRVGGEIVALGQSPRTEHFWFDTQMDDASGKRIAEMRMLLRFMKASSLLYAEDR